MDGRKYNFNMKKLEENNLLFYRISWLFLMIYAHGASGLCRSGSFGPDCRYECHCGDGTGSCSEETGACFPSQGCARGYHGDNCQKENVALDKPAAQIDTYTTSTFSYDSSLAVDGNPSTNFDDRSCTRTTGNVSVSDNGYSWWSVKLGQGYDIRYIRVYNRNDFRSRLKGMTIKIHDRLCYTSTDNIPPEIIDVACTSTLKGRDVLIRTGHDQNILTLCEVQIFVCTKYWFGENCNESCNCKDESEVCDKVTSACKSGCPDGYRDDNCKTACSNVEYGDECSESCDNCATPSTGGRKCDYTGQCYAGCIPGYKGLLCNETCDSGRYGTKCGSICNARCKPDDNGLSTCNHVNGTCTFGCQDGYIDSQELICSPKCGDDLFGVNCTQTCSCRNETEVCHKVTGACSSGCAAGFQGNDCKTDCSNGQYGFECSQSCDNCATPSTGGRKCNQVTGQCNAGCIAGYKDIFCNHTCDSRNYGINCTSICSERCKPVANELQTCHHVNGTCIAGCQDGYMVAQDSICLPSMSASTNPDSETGTSAGLIAGSVIGCVVAITLIAALIVLTLITRRRNSQKTDHNAINRPMFVTDTNSSTTVPLSSSEEKGPAQLDIVISDEANVDEAHSYLDVDSDLYCNELSLPTVSVREGIVLDDLWDYVAKQMHSGGLKAEYEKLPANLLYDVSAALKPENKGKSRYVNIYAYDRTRVILDMPPGASHTDYINANYIPGYKDPQKYIAAQGPTAIIMDDFWRMVWQENCSKIVALTRLVEGGRNKCDQYWPDSGSKEYGDVRVEMIQVEEFPDFFIRTLMIEHTKSPDKRLLQQFHFLSWPDHGVPDYATALINFKDKVETASRSTTGSIVVHCSAGIGRSGTFIGLDFLIEQAKAEGWVDIFGCVNNMRNYRVNMIQTGEQYEFLYDALLEALSLSPISLASSEFMAKYAKSNKVNNLSGKTYLQEQFELMNLLSPPGKPGDFMCAEFEGNKGKHRDANIMAADDHRVNLSRSNTDTGDYINAVYLPTYKESKSFIITQMPLADTVIDFWRMVYGNKCRTIVMLNDDNIEADACYWSRDGTALSIGPFTITSELDTVCDTYDVMSLELTHEDKVDEVLKIRQYQCKFWPSSEKVPPDATSFLAVLNAMERWQQQNENSTIVVHCTNGAEKSGVYCTISAVIDRLKIEQQVNVSQTVKRFRKCRPQIISSLEQYQFCHDAVVAYLESFETYSNFV